MAQPGKLVLIVGLIPRRGDVFSSGESLDDHRTYRRNCCVIVKVL